MRGLEGGLGPCRLLPELLPPNGVHKPHEWHARPQTSHSKLFRGPYSRYADTYYNHQANELKSPLWPWRFLPFTFVPLAVRHLLRWTVCI